MKATLGNNQENAINYGGKKELISSWDVIVNTDNGLKNIITVRCYMGRSASASTVYASIWVHSTDYQTSGTGDALEAIARALGFDECLIVRN